MDDVGTAFRTISWLYFGDVLEQRAADIAPPGLRRQQRHQGTSASPPVPRTSATMSSSNRSSSSTPSSIKHQQQHTTTSASLPWLRFPYFVYPCRLPTNLQAARSRYARSPTSVITRRHSTATTTTGAVTTETTSRYLQKGQRASGPCTKTRGRNHLRNDGT